MGARGGIPILKIAVLRYSEASTQEARGMSKSRQGDAGPLSTEQVARLEELLLASGYLSQEKARELLHWFLHELGIDPYYFSVTTVEEIASHLIAIRASRLAAQAGGMNAALQDRLLLTEARIEAMARGLEGCALMPLVEGVHVGKEKTAL